MAKSLTGKQVVRLLMSLDTFKKGEPGKKVLLVEGKVMGTVKLVTMSQDGHLVLVTQPRSLRKKILPLRAKTTTSGAL